MVSRKLRQRRLEREIIQLDQIRVRFTYAGGVKGEWVGGLDAYRNGIMFARQDREVTGMEWDRVSPVVDGQYQKIERSYLEEVS